jgi:Tfp pilus assembly major pilin PilA
MVRIKRKQSGFSTVEIVLAVLVIGVLAATGLLVYQRYRPTAATNTTQTTNQPQNTTTNQTHRDPYAGWKTFNDTGYGVATGISLKYPAGWQINISGVGKFGETSNPTGTINMRSTYYPSSSAVTPKEEWNTCAVNVSADACGAAPGDTTVSGSASTINGLAAYTATMHNSYGTYHVTVIRGNKSTSNGIPYVEFTISSNDPPVLSTFAAIMASAMFTN